MTFAEAIAHITEGRRIKSSRGSVFWLEHDNKGRVVLIGKPVGYDKSIRNLVFASEHFEPTLEWEVEK